MRQPTKEEILAKCPEIIPASMIPRKNPGGRPRTGGGRRKLKWWSEKDRIRAATVYAITGNALRTSEITGVPHGTIRQWKTQEWWPEVIRRIHQEKDDELDVKLTKIIDKAVSQVNDRLEQGDYIYNVKTGTLIRKPMAGKELASVVATFVDKRGAIRDRERVRHSEETIKDRLNDIANKFEEAVRFVNAKTVKSEVIEGEIIEESTGRPN